MPGYATRVKRSLCAALMLGAFAMANGLELQCDPVTQYKENGQCCLMCGPGTSMSSQSTCKLPKCDECKENEYQDQYTRVNQCDAQPYCDPNRNLEVTVHRSKKRRDTCMCKQGFHCTSETCSTCVSHSVCLPGSEAQVKGTRVSDTVCRKCPEGTFSNVTSSDSECKPWTMCDHGYVEQMGTDKSDNICAQSPRMHRVLWITVAILGAIAVVAVVSWRCRGNVEDKIKHFFCDDSHRGDKPNTKQETHINMGPHSPETDAFLPEQETQDEATGHGITPEENSEEESQDTGNFTDNGNYVVQERGKSDVLSRQESQTCTFADSL